MQIGEGKNGECIVSFISEHRERDFMHDGNRSIFLNKITKWPVMFVCSIHNKLIHMLCVHKTRSLTTWSAWNLALCMSLGTWKAPSICIQQTIHKVTTGSHKSRNLFVLLKNYTEGEVSEFGFTNLQVSEFGFTNLKVSGLGVWNSRACRIGVQKSREVSELGF